MRRNSGNSQLRSQLQIKNSPSCPLSPGTISTTSSRCYGGYLAILEDSKPAPSQEEYFQKASAAAQRISAMIHFTKEYEQIGVNSPVWQDCAHTCGNSGKANPARKDHREERTSRAVLKCLQTR